MERAGRTEEKAKGPLGRHKRSWENTIKIDLKVRGSEVVDWKNLAQDGTTGWLLSKWQ
jgi:hypothetical protein